VTNGVVTLAGEVPNAQVKADAEAAVRSVNGVKGVNNNLQVKSPPTP
jgi:osmotically-inducible protein OsmY